MPRVSRTLTAQPQSRRRQRLGLDLAGDLALDAGPRHRWPHDEAVEVPPRTRASVLPLAGRGAAVGRQPQQMLGPLQPLLRLGREVAAPTSDRLRLGDVECGDVFADGIAVFELGVTVAEDVVDSFGPQHVRTT